MQKVILVTGATSGIGLASVDRLAKDGHVVYGSHRKQEDASIVENAGGIPIQLDIIDYSSLETAVSRIISEKERIDVLFNNAGYGLFGAVEDTSVEDAKHQFEVNLFGLARLTQLVLPLMREQKSGTIINTSSMGGKVYTPLGAWYHATKHALEGWSDALRLELKQFNIDVVIIEPGGIQTDWGTVAADNIDRISQHGAYKSFAQKVVKGMRNNYENQNKLSPPSVIANVVSKAVRSKRPKTRYVAGAYAKPVMFLRKYFGDRIFDWVIMSQAR